MREDHHSLNANQRHRLLITCKHIDKLLSDIEATLNAAASNSVFLPYLNDLTPAQRKIIEEHIAHLRAELLRVLAGQSMAPEQPSISAAHSLNVSLTFIEISIAELAPRYMRGYGPVSDEGAADLNRIIAELQAGVNALRRYGLQGASSVRPEGEHL